MIQELSQLSYATLKILANEIVKVAKITYTSFLRVRTGRLRRSLVANVVERGAGSIDVGIPRYVVYGRIQEIGGEIKPKRARRLWIPTKQNQTPAGVARFKPRDIFRKGFIQNDIFFLKDDKTKKVKPMFVLKERVKIRGRRWVLNAVKFVRDRKKEILQKYKNLLTKHKFWTEGYKQFLKFGKG